MEEQRCELATLGRRVEEQEEETVGKVEGDFFDSSAPNGLSTQVLKNLRPKIKSETSFR